MNAADIQLFGACWCTVRVRGRIVAPAIVNLVAALILSGTFMNKVLKIGYCREAHPEDACTQKIFWS